VGEKLAERNSTELAMFCKQINADSNWLLNKTRLAMKPNSKFAMAGRSFHTISRKAISMSSSLFFSFSPMYSKSPQALCNAHYNFQFIGWQT
jgi:hypothetical protein